MKRQLYILLSTLIVLCLNTGCVNTYNRAARNYSGDIGGTSAYCQVQLVHDKRDQLLADAYIEEHDLQYFGSTNFDASTKFSKKHIAKLCRRLGGEYAVASYGQYFTESSLYMSTDVIYFDRDTKRELTVRVFGRQPW